MYYEAAKHFDHFGVKVGGLSFDWDQMQKQKNDAVSGLTKGIEGLFKKNKVRAVNGADCTAAVAVHT
jgi:dihydrolipoamide dehydrogenase